MLCAQRGKVDQFCGVYEGGAALRDFLRPAYGIPSRRAFLLGEAQ
jgi:hypothetical protein